MTRRKSRQVMVGSVPIGGDAPIAIQSMTTTHTYDVAATVAQILRLEEAGCDIVRVAVPDEKAARALPEILSKIHIPLVADIHFHYQFALMAAEAGVQKIRWNPGNITDLSRVEKVVRACAERKIPIRVGVNGGSLEKEILEKYGYPTPEALAESALRSIKLLDSFGFRDVVVSVKHSDPLQMIQAYRLLAAQTDVPLHLGVTEAGTILRGTVLSALGIGTLLMDGIGDTLRVSLTADSVEEVKVGKLILEAVGLRHSGAQVIACPSCGRCDVDLIRLAEEVEHRVLSIKSPIKVAVMGCVVNGPGEAMDADVAICGGKGQGVIYVDGKVARRESEDKLVDAMMDEIAKKIGQKTQ